MENSLDGAPSALSRLMPIAAACSSLGSETATCPDFQSGTTSELSTVGRGVGASMSSAAVSHAKAHAAQPQPPAPTCSVEVTLQQLFDGLIDDIRSIPESHEDGSRLWEALRSAHWLGRESAQGGWVVDPAKEPPQVDTFAWVVWNGTVQKQPWQWVLTDEDEQRWHYDGHELPPDEVEAYLPIKLPPAPGAEKGGDRG